MARRAAQFLLPALLLSVACARAGEPVDSDYDFRPRLISDRAYSEGWDQVFYFPDGTLFINQFTITTVGLIAQRAAMFGMLITPDGEQIILKNSRGPGDWHFAEDRFSLHLKHHYLQGQHPDYVLKLEKESGELELRYEARSEPWRPGRVAGNDDGHQYVYFYAPFARATGRYRVAATDGRGPGKWRALRDGRGFGVRYINTTSIGDLVQTATRIVGLADDKLRPVLYVVRDREGKQHAHLALFEGDRILHKKQDFNFVFEDGIPHELPRAMTIDVVGDDFRLTGTLVVKKLLAEVDPVDMVKSVAKVLVSFMNTPLQYRFLAQYEFTYSSGGQTRKLSGDALIDHMVMKDVRSEKRDQ